jgi:Fic family protein
MNIDWKLINTISQIDRFDSNWAIIEKRESRSLQQLKEVAMNKNLGASTRFEGYKLTDEESKVLIQKYKDTLYDNRDCTEITNYIETLDAILNSYASIEIVENSIINIHNVLMRYKKRDRWFKINRTHSNLESMPRDSAKQILSRSVSVDFNLTHAMNRLINWYNTEEEVHSLIKIAVFVYDFLCSFPFQSGNKRISRLIPLLLLLKNGYNWVQYVSLEQEIESRKADFIRIVRNCQENGPNENITDWILFFLDILISLQVQLTAALKRSGVESRLSPREKAIIALISNNPGSRSGEIADKLSIPNPTTKRILANLLQNGFIERYGSGRGTNYSIE